MRPRLRVFAEDGEPTGPELHAPEVSMKLEELTRILADAIIWDRSWLADLADDQVKVSADLYEVLTVYLQLRPSA